MDSINEVLIWLADFGNQAIIHIDEAEARIKMLVLEAVGDDEGLVTPENYEKFNKNDTAIFYENRDRDARNKQRVELRQKAERL